MNSILPSEHVFIVGGTGSGKTFLAESYLAHYERVIKLDIKGETEARLDKGEPLWMGLTEGKDYEVIYNFEDIDSVETKKIIYCPVSEELNAEYYEKVLKWCYDSKNITVWIDELMAICPNSRSYPESLKAIMTRGRSRFVTVYALTQRPADIPVIVPSNCKHFFMFDTRMEQDRKKMYSITGCSEMLENPPKKFSCWYANDEMKQAVNFKLKLAKGW